MDENQSKAFVDEIRHIVAKISRISESDFEDRVLIREELGIDSLMGMEIIANCEKAFGIRIDESRFAAIETVGDFLNLVKQLYEQKQA
jgi:acyl carrier protein